MDNDEVEIHDTIAAIGGPVRECVGRSVGALGVGVSVPGVAVASRDGLNVIEGDAVAHGDGNAGRGAGASVSSASDRVGGGDDGRHSDGIVVAARGPYIAAGAACGERGALIAIYVSVARNGYHGDGFDGEVQSDDTVASVGGPVGDGVGGGVGAGSVGVPVPGVAATGGDGLNALCGGATGGECLFRAVSCARCGGGVCPYIVSGVFGKSCEVAGEGARACAVAGVAAGNSWIVRCAPADTSGGNGRAGV